MVLTWPDKKDGCFKISLMQYLLEEAEENGQTVKSFGTQRRNGFRPRERLEIPSKFFVN